MSNNNFIKQLNLFGGKITYNDFDIEEHIPFQNQKFSYKEDILQVRYGKTFLLDVGWYPEMEENGYFKVRAIKDYDWCNPLSEKACRNLNELKRAIEETALIIVKAKEDGKDAA
jgi:hypothetical protein